jgi:hypothetical protein
VAAAPATRDSNKALIAIGGISAAGLVILAGVGGYAVGQYNGSHRDSDVAIARADGPMNTGPMMGDQQRPGMPGEMNGRNGQGPQGMDPDGDNWTGGNRMGGHDDGYSDDGQDDEGQGNGMQGFGQGRDMQGFAPNLQNLPPQVQELLKQFLQGQGGQQGRLQLPMNPGDQG